MHSDQQPPASRGWAGRRTLGFLVFFVVPAATLLFARAGYPPPPFRLGTQAWAGYAPGYLARADGVWDAGQVRVVELSTDAEIVRAMRSGGLEAACLTVDGALRVQAAGVDVRVVVVVDFSQGGDAVVAVGGRCATLAELRGKRVAVERHGVGMLFLARALQSAGLRTVDITIVNSDMPEHEQLVAAGRVDAIVTYSPDKERFVAAGGRVLCDSAQFPTHVIDVLVVRADAFTANPNAVRALVRAWSVAADRLEIDPHAGNVVARAMGISPAEYATGRRQIRVPGGHESAALVAGELRAAARETADSMRALGQVEGSLDPDRLLLTPTEAEVLSR